MSGLFELHPDTIRAAHASGEVIDLLRDTLARAERGEVLSVGIVMATGEGCEATSYALGTAPQPLAVLTLACQRLARRLLEHEE